MEINDIKTLMNDGIKEINEFKERINKAAEESEDVKNGKCTVDDEKAEPDFVFAQAISDTCIDIMKSEPVLQSMADFLNNASIGVEAAKPLIDLLSICMTNSAYSAIILYDNLLKKELTEQFNLVTDKFAEVIADTNAHTGAIEVLKSKIDKLTNEMK